MSTSHLRGRPVFVSEVLVDQPVEGAQVLASSIAAHLEAAHRGTSIGRRTVDGKQFLSRKLIGLRALLRIASLRPSHVVYLPLSGLTRAALIRVLLLFLAARCKRPELIVLQQHVELNAVEAFLARFFLTFVASTIKQQNSLERADPNAILLAPRVPENKRSKLESRAEARVALGFAADEMIFLHVGHAKRSRNLNALAPLAKYGRLILVLSPYEPDEPGAYPDDPSVAVVREYVENMADYYKAADVYVFPTFDDIGVIGTPMSIFEALANGTPVVARNSAALERWASTRHLTVADSDEGLVESAISLVANTSRGESNLGDAGHADEGCLGDLRSCRMVKI